MATERLLWRLRDQIGCHVALAAVDVTDARIDARSPYHLVREGIFGAPVHLVYLSRSDLATLRDAIQQELGRAPA